MWDAPVEAGTYVRWGRRAGLSGRRLADAPV